MLGIKIQNYIDQIYFGMDNSLLLFGKLVDSKTYLESKSNDIINLKTIDIS